MKVFRKEKFLEDLKLNGRDTSLYEDGTIFIWPTKCDGKEVINGKVGEYGIADEWCEEI